MEMDSYLRMVLALGVVLALITGVAWAARRFGLGGQRLTIGRRRRRLALVEALQIDNRRRLVLVRRDDVEHLVLIGGGSDIIVERGIAATDAEAEREAMGKPV